MRRIVASSILGASAGALSAFSHGVAGGMVGLGPLLVIMVGSAVAFAALPRRWRGLGGTVVLLLGLQLLAHLWLEMAHPHGHGAVVEESAHGITGAITHALTPGMLMMWAHLLAVVAGAALIVCLRPLLERLFAHAVRWWTRLFESPVLQWKTSSPAFSACRSARTTLLAHVIEGRGPPVLA